jgi:hypothetical protein
MIRAADLPQFPTSAKIQDALLLLLYNEGGKDCALWAGDTYELLAAYLRLEYNPHSANYIEWRKRVCTARVRLVNDRFLRCHTAYGHWMLTKQGRRRAERLMATLGRPAFGHNGFSPGASGLGRKQERPSEFRRTGERPTSQPGANGKGTLFELSAVGVHATACELDEAFVVQTGSTARRGGSLTFSKGYRSLRDQLVDHGELVDGLKPGTYRFARDVRFRSRSAAASVVMACSVSGWVAWKRSSAGKR